MFSEHQDRHCQSAEQCWHCPQNLQRSEPSGPWWNWNDVLSLCSKVLSLPGISELFSSVSNYQPPGFSPSPGRRPGSHSDIAKMLSGSGCPLCLPDPCSLPQPGPSDAQPTWMLVEWDTEIRKPKYSKLIYMLAELLADWAIGWVTAGARDVVICGVAWMGSLLKIYFVDYAITFVPFFLPLFPSALYPSPTIISPP